MTRSFFQRAVLCLSMILLCASSSYGFFGLPYPGAADMRAKTSLYVGYLFHDKGADLHFTAVGAQQADSITALRQEFDLSGVLFEIMQPVRLRGPLGLALGVGYMLPINGPAQETMELSGRNPSLSRTWKSEVQWWQMQAALTYNFFPRIAGVAGICFDSFQATFSKSQSDDAPLQNTSDRTDAMVLTWIPYLGVELTNIAPRAGLALNMGAMAFPVVMGSITYSETALNNGISVGGSTVNGFPAQNEFGTGYFFKGFAECVAPVGNYFDFGAFITYGVINAETNVSVGERNSAINTTDFKLYMDRRSWVFGARVDFRF
jgi:hypothetical protein